MGRSLSPSRTFLQAVNLGIAEINATDHPHFPKACSTALLRIPHYPQCPGLMLSEPCMGCCPNIMWGCLVDTAGVGVHWWSSIQPLGGALRSPEWSMWHWACAAELPFPCLWHSGTGWDQRARMIWAGKTHVGQTWPQEKYHWQLLFLFIIGHFYGVRNALLSEFIFIWQCNFLGAWKIFFMNIRKLFDCHLMCTWC